MDIILNGTTLAYIGDGYYELRIRDYIISLGVTKGNDLHQMAVKFTSGKAQSRIIMNFLENDLLSEKEIDAYKKGRNVTGISRKNLSLQEYHQATGFESLIGYLYLNDKKRADELIELAIIYIKKEQIDG
ncbi:Mini-ribonuclease 3 [Acholeplasma sp. OttesenSCG-928-E16]|nr:Mini-ribonuclease 3 [Acholeplasma sp. OttesenSCG-928-E16]